MRTTKLVRALMAGLLVVVCVHVCSSAADAAAAAPAAEDAAVLKPQDSDQAGDQTGKGVAASASDRISAAAAAGAAAGGGTGREGDAAAASDVASTNPTENAGGAEKGASTGAAFPPEASTSQKNGVDGGDNDGDDGNNNDDDDIPANDKSMKDSLADYIMDLLTNNNDSNSAGGTPQKEAEGTSAVAAGDGGNGTQPEAAAAGSSGGESGAGGTQTESQNGGEASAGSGTGSGAAGQGTPEASSAQKGQGQGGGGADQHQWSGDQWSSTDEGKSSTSTTTTTNKNIDCTREVDLRNFCEFTPEALRVFRDDTTLEGFRTAFMNMDIVQRLRACRRGEWCLENDLEVFKSMQEKIYKSALCRDSMWECIFAVMMRRESCTGDKEFLFAVDALDLMCSLSGVDVFELQSAGARPTDPETLCMAHVQAALHVSYADFLASGMIQPTKSKITSCEGDAFRMSATYLCADEHCKGQFESRKAMQEFGRWKWFLANLDERVGNCSALKGDTCGPLKAGAASSSTISWPFGASSTTSSTPFWTSTSPTGTGEGEGEGATGEQQPGMFGEEDTSLMIALSVATALVLMFMALGVLFFLRRRRARNAYYYKAVSDSYDKVPSDEAHLLGRSSSD